MSVRYRVPPPPIFMENRDLAVPAWPDYELIDSGDNRKLERFGSFTVIRPETQAIWGPRRAAAWADAHGEFRFSGAKGSWKRTGSVLPDTWQLSWNDVRFSVRLGSFKHLGVFPEQAANWEWIGERAGALKNKSGAAPRVLNLFGYTGLATIAAAKHGAHVTHVDASRQSNAWAKENADHSEIPATGIRYILDDALKFVEREARRGAEYDGIILDPPAFGRGAKGEVWRIEEDLPKLLAALAKILSKKPGAFFLLNGYAAGYAPQSFAQAVESFFGPVVAPGKGAKPEGEFGELHIIEEGGNGRVVPSGIYVRFVR